jgi:hypothetical protein
MAEDTDFDFEDLARLSRATSFQYFKTMEKALGADTRRYMDECLKVKEERGESPLSQEEYAELGFWYRGLARELLTYVEGLLFVMRRLVVYAEERGEIRLTPGEGALMRELDYTFNLSRKRIEEKPRYNRFLENFILAFQHFPQVLGSSFEVDYGAHGWEKMQRLVKMRNSLTHPKSVNDTLLIPEMPNVIRDAAIWFFGCMRDLTATVDGQLLEQSFKETAKMPEMQKLLAERAARKEK